MGIVSYVYFKLRYMSSDKGVSQNPFSIQGQFIKDVSFENFLVRNEKVAEIENEPEIIISADVSVKKLPNAKHTHEVNLTVKATAQDKDQKIFIAEVCNTAIVCFNDEFVKEHADYVDPTLAIEIPFYLFFETRNVIANLSHLGGYPPVFIRPVDFGALYQEKLK